MARSSRLITVRLKDREDAAIDVWLRQRVDEAFSDLSPNVPAKEVFKHLRELHAANLKGSRRRKTHAKD